jgi:hypothetical protein
MTRTAPTPVRSLLGIFQAPARWLERTRGRKRLALAALYSLFLVAIGVLFWRQSRLSGLPDIGDPFDPGPLLNLHLPDDQNAFVFYKQANDKARRDRTIEFRLLNAPYAYPPPSDAEARTFLADNTEAMALWRRGCECPDALYIPIRDLRYETRLPLLQEHRFFIRLALIEASRLEAAGDMAGAWEWHRTALRGSRLIGRHTCAIGSLIGLAGYSITSGRITTWAADPRVDAVLLRRAITEVRQINALSAPTSESLKVEYLSGLRMLNDAVKTAQDLAMDTTGNSGIDGKIWYYHLPGYWPVRWFLEHEPERSRRALRLIYANWLSECDRPSRARPPLVGVSKDFRLYDKRSPAEGLGPQALSALVEETLPLNTVLISYANYQKALDRDRSQRARLIVTLADQLYVRLFGKPAESPDHLIGPCLEAFPEDYVPPADPDAPPAKR